MTALELNAQIWRDILETEMYVDVLSTYGHYDDK